MKARFRLCREQTNRPLIGFILVLLLLLGMILLLHRCQGQSDRNVIFISLDTTRYDYIDTGRGARASTPNLKKFAEKSVVFERAFTTVPETLPAHLSAFTGRLPHELEVWHNHDRYRKSHPLIQEVLKSRGYQTAGIISLGTLEPDTGFSRGFDQFLEIPEGRVFYRNAREVVDAALPLLSRLRESPFFLFVHFSDPHSPYAPPDLKADFDIRLDDRTISRFNTYQGAILKQKYPLTAGRHSLTFATGCSMTDFSFHILRGLKFSPDCRITPRNLRFSTTHYQGSYLLTYPSGSMDIVCSKEGWFELGQVIPILKGRSVREFYRREVEFMDVQLGRLFSYLFRSQLLENTVVVVFADHGEGLGELKDYFGHTRYLNRQFIHIPLMVAVPGMKGQVISRPVSIAGISPAILDLLKIESPLADSSVPGLLSRCPQEQPVPSFVLGHGPVHSKLSLVQWPYQVIFTFSDPLQPQPEYYHLDRASGFSAADQIPREMIRQHSGETVVRFRKLGSVFGKFLHYSPPLLEKEEDLRGLDMLRALGYIDR